jgi:hypothetical protein
MLPPDSCRRRPEAFAPPQTNMGAAATAPSTDQIYPTLTSFIAAAPKPPRDIVALLVGVENFIHPDIRKNHGLTFADAFHEEVDRRRSEAEEATRVAVESATKAQAANVASMQRTIDDLAQANERLTQKLEAAIADKERLELSEASATQEASALREILSRRSVEVEDLKASLRRAESEKAAPAEKGCAAVAKRNIDLYNSLQAAVRRHIRDSIAQTHAEIANALAEELRLRAAEHQDNIELARKIAVAATADRDEKASRLAACEASLRKMEEDRSALMRQLGAGRGVADTLRAEIERLKEAIVSVSLAHAGLQATRLHDAIADAARAGAEASL